jgi:hypothetical protein
MNNDHKDARMIFALAAEANDEFVWDRVKILQTEMFAAGPVHIKSPSTWSMSNRTKKPGR